MAISFTLKVEDDKYEIVMAAFGASVPAEIETKVLEYLLNRIRLVAKDQAHQTTEIDGDEIEIDES